MQTWKTIIVIVLLAMIGGYAYYVSRQPTEQTSKVYNVSAGDIQKIELRSPQRDIVVERVKDGWRFLKPIEGEAESTAADGIADAIANLQITSSISENPGDLAPFGLRNPAVSVIVTTKDGRVLPTIMVGKDTPVGSSSYIRTGQKPGVLLVANTFPPQVEKSVDDLRPRTLIGFKSGDVRKIVLDSSSGTSVELVKKGDQWSIVKPTPYPADNSAVQQILDGLTNARVAEFIDDNPSDLSKYGLSTPSFKLVLYGGKSNGEESLLFGFKQPQPDKLALYARRGEGSDQPVITVNTYVFNSLDKSFDDLRDKTVMVFDRSKVARVAIDTGRFQETLVRASGSKWNVISNDKTAAAEALVAASLLDQLHDLKGSRIVEDPMTHPERYGMVKPTLTLTAYDENGRTLGTVRASTMQTMLEPKPEDTQNTKPQSHYSAYAITSPNSPVFEVPVQAVTDLENTVGRLRSDVSPTPAAQSKAPSAQAAPK
jgi:Domain of unknown function (DUF4340)